ncbi:hypothetical protein JX266_007239 [Neoarthrinium moseri]|nr:hypothetical protein JX266_007239 [Neoarthrinium moseri]
MATPSTAQPTRWAQQSDWDLHRETITNLYGRQGMTLKEVKRCMESEHHFYATNKQYKWRLSKWGIYKNFNLDRVSKMVRQGASSSGKPGAPAQIFRAGLEKRLHSYLNQLPEEKYRLLASIGDPSASQVAAALADFQVPGSILTSIRSPDDLRVIERCKYAMRHYVIGARDSKMWVLDPSRTIMPNELQSSIWEPGVLASTLLLEGKTQEAFRVLHNLFNDCRRHLVQQQPLLFIYVYLVALLYSERHPELATSFTSYLRDLTKILYPTQHPLRTLTDSMQHLGPAHILDFSRVMLEGYIEALQHEFGAYSLAMAYVVQFTTTKLAVVKKMEWTVAEETLRQYLNKLEEESSAKTAGPAVLGMKRALAWILFHQARYSEARELYTEVAVAAEQADEHSVRLLRSIALINLSEIALIEGNHEEILLALSRQIRCIRDTFGPNDTKMVSSLLTLETYLRKTGDVETADRIQRDFEAVMDQISGNLEDLNISVKRGI